MGNSANCNLMHMHNTEMYLKKHNSDTNNQIICIQNYTIKSLVHIQYTT